MANVTPGPEITPSSSGSTEMPVIFHAILTRSGYNALAFYTGFLTVAGIFNNGLVIFLFIKFTSLRQPVNYFLLNLSVSDMTISLFASPMTFASNVAGKWIFGRTGCSIYAFLVMMAGFEQIVALAAVSVHRCFLVVRPFTAKKMTKSWALLFVSLTWAYSFIMTVPPAFGWNEYVPEGAGTACAINWTDAKPGNTSYVIFIFVMVLAVPLTVITFSYGLLIFAVKKIGASEAAQSTENKAEGRVTKMVVIMIALYLFAWSPYAALSLYVAFGDGRTVSPVVATLPPFFAKACTIYNPILYFLTNRQFRDALYELIGYQPPEDSDSTGGGRNNRNAQREHSSSMQHNQLRRSASQATVMSELHSTIQNQRQPVQVAPASSRAKMASRKVRPEPIQLSVPLPGQPLEMHVNPTESGEKTASETKANTLSVISSPIEKQEVISGCSNKSIASGPPPYSELSDHTGGGVGYDNTGYQATESEVTTTDCPTGVTVLTHRKPSGMPEVNV